MAALARLTYSFRILPVKQNMTPPARNQKHRPLLSKESLQVHLPKRQMAPIIILKTTPIRQAFPLEEERTNDELRRDPGQVPTHQKLG